MEIGRRYRNLASVFLLFYGLAFCSCTRRRAPEPQVGTGNPATVNQPGYGKNNKSSSTYRTPTPDTSNRWDNNTPLPPGTTTPKTPGGNSGSENGTIRNANPRSTACIDARADICAIEQRVGELTNEVRTQRGASALIYDADIARVSRMHSADQASMGMISHNGFGATRQAEYEKIRSKSLSALFLSGENVLFTYGEGTEAIARDMISMWVQSSGHLQNIMAQAVAFGVGVSFDPQANRYYATQIFALSR